MTTSIAIGEGRTIEPIECRQDDPARVVGYIERHPRLDNGEPCSGFLWTDATSVCHVDGPVWEVVSAAPLTLKPSILCRACKNHGYIRGGKWEPVP